MDRRLLTAGSKVRVLESEQLLEVTRVGMTNPRRKKEVGLIRARVRPSRGRALVGLQRNALRW
jgi:hypothetical protein